MAIRRDDPTLSPDPRDVVDLSFAPPSPPATRREGGENPECAPDTGAGSAKPAGKLFLRLWFSCAGQYGRAYRNREGTKYVGRCPRCGGCVQFGIGEGGTSRRQFEVSCGG